MHLRALKRPALFLLWLVIPQLQGDITLPGAAPPQADAQVVRVWRGGQATIALRGHHAGSGSVIFSIVKYPVHGKLSDPRPEGDNRAMVTYRNDGMRPARSDGFSYVVKTSGNQVSSPADVRILVDEPPARLAVPARIEFGASVAGETETRQLAITNEGGGVLEGRLTISNPWELALPDYRVEAGETEKIDIAFRPNEEKTYVGQITLSGADGAPTTVLLEATATSPLSVEPNPLRIPGPKDGDDRRIGTVSLTNHTDRAMALTFQTSANIKTIEQISLGPKEKRKLSVELVPGLAKPLRETISIVAPRFIVRLPIVAEGLAAKGAMESKAPTPAAVRRDAVAGTTTAVAASPIVNSFPALAPTPVMPSGGTASFVQVSARRIDSSRWELRWSVPKDPAAKYRIEERLLSLGSKGELQSNWREIAPRVIAASGSAMTAQLEGLNPRELHLLRVSALDRDASPLWESSLVALPPRPESSSTGGWWLLIFGSALILLLIQRWRANRPVA